MGAKRQSQSQLTSRHMKFCEEYIKDMNGTQAAIRAGYAPAAAKVQASRLLTYDNVQEYLTKLRAEARRDSIAELTEVLERITSILRDPESDPKDVLKAAELIGKRYGAWTEKVQTTVELPQFGGEDDLSD